MSIFTPRVWAAYRSFHNYRAQRTAIRTLGLLDDALLKDIGISRSQTPSVVEGLNPRGTGTIE